MHGLDAIKSHIQAARTVAGIVRTSLGPRGINPSLSLSLFARSYLLMSESIDHRVGQDYDLTRWRYHGYKRWCNYYGSNAGKSLIPLSLSHLTS